MTRRQKWGLALCAPMACIGIVFHYVDVPAGGALAATGIALVCLVAGIFMVNG